MRRAAWAMALGFLTVVPAAGRDIRVSNTVGDNRNTGHHWENLPDHSGPVKTIRRALELVHFGDRVVLADTHQPYREDISLEGSQHSGNRFTPFILFGNGAVLDGSAPVPHRWQHFQGAVFRFQPRSGGAQQLFLHDLPAVRVAAKPNDPRPPKLEPLQWALLQGQIYFCVEKDKLPADYDLSYAEKETGITLYHVDHVAILDLIVQGFRLDGINAANSATNVQIKGVICRGNGRYGIAVGGASLLDIEDCKLGENGKAQLVTMANSQTHLRDSDLFPHSAPAWIDEGGVFYLNGKQLHGGLEKISRDEK